MLKLSIIILPGLKDSLRSSYLQNIEYEKDQVETILSIGRNPSIQRNKAALGNKDIIGAEVRPIFLLNKFLANI